MEIKIEELVDYIGLPFRLTQTIDGEEYSISGITTYVSRLNSGETGVGDFNIGYTDKDGDPKDFYAFGQEKIDVIA